MRSAQKVPVRKPEEKRPLGKPRLRWEDNIEMDLKRNRFGERGLDLSGSGQEKVLGCYEALIDVGDREIGTYAGLTENWLAFQEDLYFMELVTESAFFKLQFINQF